MYISAFFWVQYKFNIKKLQASKAFCPTHYAKLICVFGKFNSIFLTALANTRITRPETKVDPLEDSAMYLLPMASTN